MLKTIAVYKRMHKISRCKIRIMYVWKIDRVVLLVFLLINQTTGIHYARSLHATFEKCFHFCLINGCFYVQIGLYWMSCSLGFFFGWELFFLLFGLNSTCGVGVQVWTKLGALWDGVFGDPDVDDALLETGLVRVGTRQVDEGAWARIHGFWSYDAARGGHCVLCSAIVQRHARAGRWRARPTANSTIHGHFPVLRHLLLRQRGKQHNECKMAF